MRGALLAGLMVAAIGGEAAAEEPVAVEVDAARREVFVGEPIRLTLRVRVDAAFLREGGVRASLRPLDVPVLVEAPWVDGVPGAPASPAAREDPDGPTLALNDGVVRAQRSETLGNGGTTAARVFEIDRMLLPAAPGEIAIPETTLRAVEGTRFEEDALGGRIALERRDIVVRAPALRIRVLPLPEEGRPSGFGGAVGRFTIRAEASLRDVAVGEGLKLLLHIEGEGNLASFDPPRLDRLEGFHLRGSVEARTEGRRTITYDLAPLGTAVREIPAIPFAYFDPGPPAGYREVRTDAVPIRVLPGSGPVPAPGSTGEVTEQEKPSGGGGAIVVVLLAMAVAILAAQRRRAAAPAGADNGLARLAAASAEFRARADADLAGAFAAFLGARLDLPAAAAVSPDLAERLSAAGVPAATAARAARLLDLLVGARYGGGPPPADAGEQARALVEEIARLAE